MKASIISSTSAVPKEIEMIATESSMASDSLFFCALVATNGKMFWSRMAALLLLWVDEAHSVASAYQRYELLFLLVLRKSTATATSSVRDDIVSTLEMSDHVMIRISPNPIQHHVHCEEKDQSGAGWTLLTCSVPYGESLYPLPELWFTATASRGPGAPELCDNRLFGMFHASSPQHSKDVITSSSANPCGVVQVVFASVALGMGINLRGENNIIQPPAA